MAYCSNCGSQLVEGAKFCQKCGASTGVDNSEHIQRQQEYTGKIYKCPNCGEELKSFVTNCPSCGFELRGVKAASSVREFALKLEAIESRREYEKPRGFFGLSESMVRIGKTDEQKISLIKSFSVPNSKEDMLEFMILATSNMNMDAYDSSNTKVTKGDKELNAAWFSKVQQVYEKAKRSQFTDGTFGEIQELYNKCNKNIRKSKKKGITKWVLMFGWMPILFIAIFIWAGIYAPISEEKELERLNAIVDEIEMQIENEEYKYALMNADSLVYEGTISNDEQERKWKIEREYWIDLIIEEAEKDGIYLERPTEQNEENNNEDNDDSSSGGFEKGFNDALHSNDEEIQKNIDEFKENLNGGESSGSQDGN